MAAIVNCNGM